jgi:hypothetical protein
VSRLPKDVLVEIDCIAVVGNGKGWRMKDEGEEGDRWLTSYFTLRLRAATNTHFILSSPTTHTCSYRDFKNSIKMVILFILEGN